MRASLIAALALAGCAHFSMPTSLDDAVNQAQDAAVDGAKQTGQATAQGVYQGVTAPTKECNGDELKKYELNPESEYWFGRSVADRLLAPYVPDRVYAADSSAAVYLNQVGQIAVAGAEKSRTATDRAPPAHGYRFILVKDANPGAWSTPGGFVIVTDGLVARAASEDQLAGILAHEVAHVQRGHGVTAFERATCENKNSRLTAAFEGIKQGLTSAAPSLIDRLPLDKLIDLLEESAQGLAESLSSKGYGPQNEYEADAYGTRYLARSGYSAVGIADYLTRVGSDPAFKGDDSHPAPSLRIQAVQKEVDSEGISPARSANEGARTPRFVKAMIASGIRSDWNPGTDPAQAPLLPQKTASAN